MLLLDWALVWVFPFFSMRLALQIDFEGDYGNSMFAVGAFFLWGDIIWMEADRSFLEINC
jgi:hypothetical protein